MAAPQTHFVITWVIFKIFTWGLGVAFNAWEIVAIFFWGFLIDFDHFLNPSFVKDLFKVRIPNLLRGKGGEPSAGVKQVPAWMHLWPGFLLSLGCSVVFYILRWSWFFVPFAFYFIHYWGIDRWQISLPQMPDYLSFLYPFKKKGYRRKIGYPVKARAEILVATPLALFIILFELIKLAKRVL